MSKLAAFSTSVVSTLLLAAMSYAGTSATSNKWRIEMSGQALTSGEIVFRVTPRQGEAVDVSVGIRSGRAENNVAKDVRDALAAKLSPDRYTVEVGDAKDLLPPLIDRLEAIDMFFHDSDHTYNHMMFEFDQAMRKLAPDGVIVADDISWNASLWDFADKYRLPSYNYCGSMGVAFLPATT